MLGTEVVEAYRRDGSVVIAGMLPADVLAEVASDVPGSGTLHSPHQTSPAINRVCRRADLVGAAMDLLGEQVYIHESRIDVGEHLESRWREDGIPAPNLVTAVVFLDDGSVLLSHPGTVPSTAGRQTLVVVYNAVSNPPANKRPMPVVMSTVGSRRAAYARRLATASLDRGDPTGWFEELYAAAQRGETKVPWADLTANQYLVSWVAGRSGTGQRALVVGCGLGDDAEFLAGLGFDVVAFDVSQTAVDGARSRFPTSTVDYRVADILDPPGEWRASYDLVFEAYTVQVHQSAARGQAVKGIAAMLAPGGTLLVLAHSRPFDGEAGPPWPLTREEVGSFAVDGLEPVGITEITDDNPPGRRWLAEFRRQP
ncbi:class I SAM-dependent methyltransferase [Actinocrispum sp. NPDC049592]|uniref:class I SAM-dependent methyltransferase n=1 Tax=Actinocrispum sp. NPDC049592 TaxID=3154835 RepID=UPI00343B7407